MTIRLNLTGSETMMSRMRKVAEGTSVNLDLIIIEEAENILQDSKDNYVPVEAGDLRESGRLLPVILEGAGIQILHKANIAFGDFKTNAYAAAIHEHPSSMSPPSWAGKKIKWSKPGTGPKYLERPIKKAQRGMAGRVAAKADALMRAIPGAFTNQ